MSDTRVPVPGWNPVKPIPGGHEHVWQCTADLCGAYVREASAQNYANRRSHDREFHRTDKPEVEVEVLRERLAEACTLLQDARPAGNDPGNNRTWGRRRKVLVDTCIDDEIWPVR